MTYRTTEYEVNRKVTFYAENDKITSKDEMEFERGDVEGTTLFTYKANIKLKGFLKIFTVFIKSDLEELAEQTRQGIIKRSGEIFLKD